MPTIEKPFRYRGTFRVDGPGTTSNDERADAAAAALDSFPENFKDGDPMIEIQDLITDLLHLADRIAWNERDEREKSHHTSGDSVLRMATWNWQEERSK